MVGFSLLRLVGFILALTIQENAKIQPKAIFITKFDRENIDENNTEAFDNIEMW